jgi:serine phosphatase RsbU (regulator of sigma subunit)
MMREKLNRVRKFIEWSVNLGVLESMPFVRKQSIRNLNIVSLTCVPFPTGLSLLLMHFAPTSVWQMVLGIWSSMALMLVPVFNHFQKFHIGRFLMNFSIGSTLIADAYFAGGGYGLELPFFVVLIGAFSFNEFNWEVKLYTLFSLVGLLTCLSFYYANGNVGKSGSFVVHASFAASSILFSFICLSVLKLQTEDYEASLEEANLALKTRKEQLQLQHDDLSKLNSVIREKNEKLGHKNFMITESLNYARRIQISTLPDTTKLERLLGSCFVLYKPKDIVSGDFYWADEIDGLVYFAVADCTGHGVPGAFMSLLGINTLHQIMLDPAFRSPASILQELDNRITEQLGSGLLDETSREGMDISLCVLNKNNATLRFASAGRPVMIVRDCKVTEYKGSRVYVGKNYVQDSTFTEYEVSLQQGDMLYMFTDGLTDQFDIQDKKKFGLARLRSLLPEIYYVDVHAQQELVRHEFERWKGYTPQTDDVLMMGYRFA